jgi:hypothetical protein
MSNQSCVWCLLIKCYFYEYKLCDNRILRASSADVLNYIWIFCVLAEFYLYMILYSYTAMKRTPCNSSIWKAANRSKDWRIRKKNMVRYNIYLLTLVLAQWQWSIKLRKNRKQTATYIHKEKQYTKNTKAQKTQNRQQTNKTREKYKRNNKKQNSSNYKITKKIK